jgi:hypothetical protein
LKLAIDSALATLHDVVMASDDPLDDLKKGFGFLARAAKSAVEKLPTKDLEDVVSSGVREVGRALGNVKDTIEEEFFDKKAADGSAPAKAPEAANSPEASATGAPTQGSTPASVPEKSSSDKAADKADEGAGI